jgi:hypothetical protein
MRLKKWLLWVTALVGGGAVAHAIAFSWWWKVEFKTAVEVLTMLGEWAVAYVIYHELGSAREQLTEAEKNRRLTGALELLREYSSPEMTDAMRGLFRWHDRYPDTFAKRFVEELTKQTEEGDRLDNWRRYTFRYFQKVLLLSDADLIDPTIIAFTIHNNPRCYGFLNNVLRPLQQEHTHLWPTNEKQESERDAETFDYFRKHYTGPTTDQ